MLSRTLFTTARCALSTTSASSSLLSNASLLQKPTTNPTQPLSLREFHTTPVSLRGTVKTSQNPANYKPPLIKTRITKDFDGPQKAFTGIHYMPVPEWTFTDGIEGFWSGETWQEWFYLQMDWTLQMNKYLFSTEHRDWDHKNKQVESRRLLLNQIISTTKDDPKHRKLFLLASQLYIHQWWLKLLMPRSRFGEVNTMSIDLEVIVSQQYGSPMDFFKELKHQCHELRTDGYVWVMLDGNMVHIVPLGGVYCSTHPQNIEAYYKMNPIFCVNMWERAYLGDYGVNKEKYLDHFFENGLNWQQVAVNMGVVDLQELKSDSDGEEY